MFRDFAPKTGYFLKKIREIFFKKGPMFRDFGAKNGTHVKGFL